MSSLAPWFRPVSEDIAIALDGAPEHEAIDGLLALAVTFANLTPLAPEAKGIWLQNAEALWDFVWLTGWPRPSGMVRVKRVKPQGGMLSATAREAFDVAKDAIAARKKSWEELGSEWARMFTADIATVCLICACRCANPSNIGKREWCALVERAWDEKAMELEMEVYGEAA